MLKLLKLFFVFVGAGGPIRKGSPTPPTPAPKPAILPPLPLPKGYRERVNRPGPKARALDPRSFFSGPLLLGGLGLFRTPPRLPPPAPPLAPAAAAELMVALARSASNPYGGPLLLLIPSPPPLPSVPSPPPPPTPLPLLLLVNVPPPFTWPSPPPPPLIPSLRAAVVPGAADLTLVT